MKILIVEDEADRIRSVIRRLKDKGFDILIAKTYTEFLDVFSKYNPKYMIIDKRLPLNVGKRVDPNCGERIVHDILNGRIDFDIEKLFVFTYDIAQDDLRKMADKEGFSFFGKLTKFEIVNKILKIEKLS